MKSLLLALLCLLAVVNNVNAGSSSRYLRSLANAEDKLDKEYEEVAQTSSRGLVDLVHLIPFDVQIAVTINKGIQTHEVSNIVTEWMNEAYRQHLAAYGYTEQNQYAEFDSVVLFNNEDSGRRALQQSSGSGSGELYTAKFKGGAVFSRDDIRSKSVPPNDVLLIQQVTLLNDTALAERLQRSDELGLGSVVVDVNAFLNPVSVSNTDVVVQNQDDGLAIVIIVAIVVACVAFLFLLAAAVWAYTYDRFQHDAFLVKDRPDTMNPHERTDEDTANDNDSPERIHAVHVERSGHAYPEEIGGDDGDHGYPESVISDSVVSGSVISEDISTSLSAYYRAGMGKVGITNSEYGRSGGLLDDAGSVSSMESYGYSIDDTEMTRTTPIPCDAPYSKDRERIGGLPVEPDNLDKYDETEADVQIPDLDKELANLDIKLSSKMEHVGSDVESYSVQDLEEYQNEDLEEMEALSQRSPATSSSSRGGFDRPVPDDVDIALRAANGEGSKEL